ncbi:MAG: hypothetical protein AAF478_11260 [Pseudomonadota bacterium]
MSTSTSNTGHLELGYRIRRANLEACGGLMIFPHDLGVFCIPLEEADHLAHAYRRYLWASGILDWRTDPGCHEQLFECDQQTLLFFHERNQSRFIKGEFSLEAAIEFVWLEAKVSLTLSIRWCMMMEFVTYEDQRHEIMRKERESCLVGNSECDDPLSTRKECADDG